VLAGPTSDPPGDAFLAKLLPTIGWTPDEALTNYGGNPDLLVRWCQQATIGLSVVSERILLERMMDFWSNKLNVYGKKPGVGILKNYSDYHIIRPNALGSVKHLLTAFAKDTSVLYYLDNVNSSGPVPNENWAREYLELYTMGQDDPIFGGSVPPNYKEEDVQAAAAAFTGWSYDPAPGPNRGLFLYKPGQHLSGPKTFMGIRLVQDDTTPGEGDQVVSIVVNSLKTGRGMAAKMIRHLLRRDPTPAQINSASLIYRGSGVTDMVGDILSQANVSALTPADYLLSSPSRFMYQALRAMGATPEWNGVGPLTELQRMGNAPFEWPAPDGYTDVPEKWAGGIFARWEFANKLFTAPDMSGQNPEFEGVVFTDAELLAKVKPYSTVMDIINNLDDLFTGGVLSDNEKSVLEAYVNVALAPPFSVSPFQVLRELFALSISTPTFQYY